MVKLLDVETDPAFHAGWEAHKDKAVDALNALVRLRRQAEISNMNEMSISTLNVAIDLIASLRAPNREVTGLDFRAG